MQLELGVAGCPFKYNFKIWGDLATDTWVKSLWERIRHFDLSLEVDYKTLEMPRECDECIMETLVREGIHGKRLVGINRARKAQEALFWSDIATADGKRLTPPTGTTGRTPLSISWASTDPLSSTDSNSPRTRTGKTGTWH